MRFSFVFLVASLIIGALICAPIVSAARAVSYEGHRVYRLFPASIFEIHSLQQFSSAHKYQLDWWVECRAVHRFCDVRVPPTLDKRFAHFIAKQGIKSKIMIENVEKKAHEIEEAGLLGDDWFSAYHDYPTTVTWIQSLAAQYPTLATVKAVGTSYENRTIYGVEVTGNSNGNNNDKDNNKPTIFLDGGIHAREWIAPATVQYALNTLLTQYSTNATIASLVNSIRWVFIPIYNVDGYEYTWTGDRMWRKTRRPNDGSDCIGTDPCRNAPTGWGQNGGSSTDPCADDYEGPNALSEVEVSAVVNYALSFGSALKGYINFHSYSQLFMSSWGYTADLPPQSDYNKQIALGKAFVSAIADTTGTQYTSGAIYSTIYPASGVMSDTIYGEGKVVYSYSCELRDTGADGFLLPPQQIVPTGQEIFAGLVVLANQILSEQA